jgi:hypothetical protein
MRVGTKQKKVNINVPNLDDFIHKVYINAARKIYTNVYLFENGITQLKLQRNARDLEVLIRECIVQTIRENIPVEELLKLYMTETIEDAIEVHEKDEIISQEPIIQDQGGGSGIGAAGSMTNPSYEESEKLSKEEKNNLEMIKAASDSASNTNTNVSFNMDNNQVIPIPPNENKHSSRDDNYDDDNDYDIDDDDDDDDGYAENVKLKIGGNVELSVDPFPADSDNGSGLGTDDGNGDSDVELTIDEIPMIDGY